jgi:HK97 family phage portal protein
MLFKKKKTKTRAEPTKSQVASFILNDGDTDFFAEYITLDKKEEVRRCVYKIADLVSNMTIMLMQNGKNGDIRIKNELSRKIDVAPCKSTTRKNFIHQIVTEMCNSGNAVVFPVISKEGYIEDLQLLHGCSFIAQGDSYLIRYAGVEFKPDDVLHFVLNPVREGYRGLGIAPLISNSVQNLAQANATKSGFLKSKWKPSLIIAVNSDIEELMNAETRNKIRDSYIDDAEAGKPWLIPSGDIDIKTVQPLTLQDLAIQESITLDLQTISSAIGVPPFMLGIGDFDKDAYNNFISTVIMSFATIIQQELTKKLLYSPDFYFKFNPKSLLQYNLGEKVEFVKEMVSGGMLNRNEGRNEFDYSPVDAEGMNDYIVLENYIPVSKVGDQEKLQGGAENSEK